MSIELAEDTDATHLVALARARGVGEQHDLAVALERDEAAEMGPSAPLGVAACARCSPVRRSLNRLAGGQDAVVGENAGHAVAQRLGDVLALLVVDGHAAERRVEATLLVEDAAGRQVESALQRSALDKAAHQLSWVVISMGLLSVEKVCCSRAVSACSGGRVLPSAPCRRCCASAQQHRSPAARCGWRGGCARVSQRSRRELTLETHMAKAA